MSRISFDVGDYQKQIDKGVTQDGLLYFNPINRNIAVGGTDAFVNFSNLMINDNQQLTDNYTNTSKYLIDNYITIDNNSKDYYSVDKANDIIGTTDTTMVNGYIQQNMQTLINGIPYEGAFDYTYSYAHGQVVGMEYWFQTTKQYTIYYPDVIDKQFSMLLLFVYQEGSQDINLTPIIATTDGTHDTTINFLARRNSVWDDGIYPNVSSTIYKAFWI